MNSVMMVYGFGSYFLSKNSYRDVDILIVHGSESFESCMRAIELKKNIMREVKGAHISILSKSAEAHFDFIFTSRAILLGIIDENEFTLSIDNVISTLESQKNITSAGTAMPIILRLWLHSMGTHAAGVSPQNNVHS